MDAAQIVELSQWVTRAGLAGKPETDLVQGFCERVAGAGVPLSNSILIIDTLHPIHEGRAFRWRRGEPETVLIEYGRTNEGAAAESWRRSPFYYLLETNQSVLRRRLVESGPASGPHFPVFDELRGGGGTDYLALVSRF